MYIMTVFKTTLKSWGLKPWMALSLISTLLVTVLGAEVMWLTSEIKELKETVSSLEHKLEIETAVQKESAENLATTGSIMRIGSIIVAVAVVAGIIVLVANSVSPDDLGGAVNALSSDIEATNAGVAEVSNQVGRLFHKLKEMRDVSETLDRDVTNLHGAISNGFQKWAASDTGKFGGIIPDNIPDDK